MAETHTQFDASMLKEQVLLYAADLAAIYEAERKERLALEKTLSKLGAIVRSMPAGLAVTDGDLLIRESNPALARLANQKESGIIGQPLDRVLPSTDWPQLRQQVFDCPLQGQPAAGSYLLRLSQPVSHTLRLDFSPLQVEGAREWVCLVHDVTAEQRTLRLKNEFIDIASHELRTPVAVVRGYLDLARLVPLPEIREMMDDVRTSVEELQHVVQRLMLLAEVNGELSRPSLPVDLAGMLDSLVRDLRRDGCSADLRLSLPKSAVVVSGDSELLTAAMRALVENAVSVTPDAEPVVLSLSIDTAICRLRVTDRGPGIPMAEQERIFQPFYQVEQPLNRRRTGMGLGLALARRIAEVYHGRLSLESVPGQGATFELTFPCTL